MATGGGCRPDVVEGPPDGSSRRAKILAIVGCALFDPPGGRMLPDRTIIIEDDRIRAVGTPDQPVAIPPEAHTIDARGKYVIPGLIDAHVHLVHVLNMAGVTGDEVLPLFLAAGVTSVRSTGAA